MKNELKEYWRKRNRADAIEEKLRWEDEMVTVIQRYVSENYPNIEDTGKLVGAVKRDFESDLVTRVVAEALDCDIELVRRFRYTRDRGIIDTHEGRRQSIPTGIREEIEDRDNGRCVKCMWEYDLSLHHIIPKSHGGSDHMSNLALLCQDCHLDAHAGDFSERRIPYDDREDFWNSFVEE